MRILTVKGKHTVKVGSHSLKNMTSKPAIMKRREYKGRIFKMNLKLREQQLKTNLHVDYYVKTSW